MKFFEKSPSISWETWFSRRLFSFAKVPKLITVNPRQIEKSYIGTYPKKATAACSSEYTRFLARYFSTTVQLQVPSEVFETYLDNGLVGVEVRNVEGVLIGTVFSWYTGIINDTQCGLITWLCVHPNHRKKGVADILLHTIQNLTYPRTIHFFRNDGWLKSPLPPLWTDTRIYRKKMDRNTSLVQKVSLESKRNIIIDSWNKKHPEGLILDDPKFLNPLTEVWEYKLNGTLLILQQTYETEPYTNRKWCEIIYWVSDYTDYELGLLIEIIIDSLPYDYIDAPQNMPHVKTWSLGGQTSWSVHGLDPGSPVIRPVLSLLAV